MINPELIRMLNSEKKELQAELVNTERVLVSSGRMYQDSLRALNKSLEQRGGLAIE